MRTRQRNPRPFQRLEGNRVPALRLKEIVQEIFRVRLRRLRRQRRTVVSERRRGLLRRPLPRALNSVGSTRRWRVQFGVPPNCSGARPFPIRPTGKVCGFVSAMSFGRDARNHPRDAGATDRFPARLPASDLPPPNRAGAVLIRPASRRRWPRPALSRR